MQLGKDDLLERILSPDNLRKAYKQVVGNKGAGGVDKMGTSELLPYLNLHLSELIEKIKSGKYKPTAVRRVEIPKDNGKKRQLGIPTVVDRFIQQAISQVLIEEYEPLFSDNSFTKCSNGKGFLWLKKRLTEYIRRLIGYYYLADMKTFLQRTEEWYHRRIRSYIWKCWKRVRTRFKNLMKCGISRWWAWQWANTRKGYWRIADSAILHIAITNEGLALRRLPNLHRKSLGNTNLHHTSMPSHLSMP